MKRYMILLCLVAAVGLTSAAAQAAIGNLDWTFTHAADYYVDGDDGTAPSNVNYMPVITEGTGAYVPARPWINADDTAYGSDWASVFARVNTQAYHLNVGNIVGGGFALTGMNHPDAVYGSLYLSPTGGGGSTVLINISPMEQTASNGAIIYTFGLDSRADVLINSPNWTYAEPQGSLTFGEVIDWVDSSSYAGTYAAFFGPQIGMSGTSGTTFTVTEIGLNTVPEPATIVVWGLLGVIAAGYGAWRRRTG
jgi:hypothetical protein